MDLNLQINKGGKFLKKLWCCVGGELQDYLVSSTALGHRKEIRKLTFRALALRRSDKRLQSLFLGPWLIVRPCMRFTQRRAGIPKLWPVCLKRHCILPKFQFQRISRNFPFE